MAIRSTQRGNQRDKMDAGSRPNDAVANRTNSNWTRRRRRGENSTLNPNALSGSFIFAQRNTLNILISGAQICQNTFPVAFKNSTADRSHFRTAAKLSVAAHTRNKPAQTAPTNTPAFQTSRDFPPPVLLRTLFLFHRAGWRFERFIHQEEWKTTYFYQENYTDSHYIQSYVTSDEGCMSFCMKFRFDEGIIQHLGKGNENGLRLAKADSLMDSRRVQSNYDWWIGVLERHCTLAK